MPSPWAVIRNAETPIETASPSLWAPIPEQPMDQADTRVANVVNHFGEGPGKPIPPALQARLDEPSPMQQDIANTQDRLQQVRYAQTHPWGTPENHPGKLGKLAHVFSEVGNIAGNIVAPNVMANIPQTQLGMKAEESRLTGRLNEEEKNKALEQEQGATTAHLNAETPEIAPNAEANRQHLGAETRLEGLQGDEAAQNLAQGPNLARSYDFAVNDALKRGVDPATDPVVQHLADAITGIQPQRLANQKPDAPEQQYIDEYQKLHPGSMVAQAIKSYTDTTTKPPQFLGVIPNAGGGFTAHDVKPGSSVDPRMISPTQLGQGNEKETQEKEKLASSAVGLGSTIQTMADLAKQNTGPADFGVIMAFVGAVKPENVGKIRWQKAEQDYIEGLRSSFGDVQAWGNKIQSGQRLTDTEKRQMIQAVQMVQKGAAREAGLQWHDGSWWAQGADQQWHRQ